MSTDSRLQKAFEHAPRLPWSDSTRYVIISDCHRGCGTSNDNFLKNQNLFFAALEHYYREGFTYLELGDGDELWENRSMKQIIEIHSSSFWLLSHFYQEHRLYMLYGNHDMVKRSPAFSGSNCSSYYCSDSRTYHPLLPDIRFHEGVILENAKEGPDLYLTHGHQADALNSTFWRLSRFLVRYVWKPLEHIGLLDPTSAARNNTKKDSVEQRLSNWALRQGCLLITGHTHRPSLDAKNQTPYLNAGSCVHPRCITVIELVGMKFTLVKWTYCTRDDFTVCVCRQVLAGPMEFPASVRAFWLRSGS